MRRLPVPGEHPRKTIRRGFVVVRNVRVLTELHLHGVSHLVRDDADGCHVAIGAKLVGGSLGLPGNEDVVVVDRIAQRAVHRIVRVHHPACGWRVAPIAGK